MIPTCHGRPLAVNLATMRTRCQHEGCRLGDGPVRVWRHMGFMTTKDASADLENAASTHKDPP